MRRILATAAIGLLLMTGPVGAQSDLKAKVEAAIEPLRKAPISAQVVGILMDGRPHVFAYGSRSADSSQPVDGDTLFEIGSCTKTFTALALAGMVHDKLVKYDDPVRLYLPSDWRVPTRGGKEITLEHLATHTSGLPRVPAEIGVYAIFNSDPYRQYTPALLRRFLSQYTLPRDIGAKWEYSNVGMGLLGYALSRQVGVGYEQLIRERVCKPLGLRDTCVTLSPEQQRRLAQGHSSDGKPVSEWHFDAIAGAGALRSSANDLLRYLAAQMGQLQTPLDAAIRDSQIVRVNKTDLPNHGQALAWLAMSLGERQPPVYWHNGGTGGFASFIGFRRDAGLAVVVLSNRQEPVGNAATTAGIQLLVELDPLVPASRPAAK